MSYLETGAMMFELAKIDLSLCTFMVVHNSIGSSVVDKLGSEEQRKRLLPELVALDKIICFGLTEPDYGSDASSLKTSAKKVEGGYQITG